MQNEVWYQGLSQAAPLRQSRTAIEIVPLKNGQGDNLSPSKFREKTRKEAHTKRFISVQKLQAESHALLLFLSEIYDRASDYSRSRGAAKFGRNLVKYMSVQHI